MKKKTIDHTQLLLLTLLSGGGKYGHQKNKEPFRRADRTL